MVRLDDDADPAARRGGCAVLHAGRRADGGTTLAQDRVGVIQIPQGQVHGAVALQDDTAVIEVKPGPYRANKFMNWAPAEGSTDTGAFLNWLADAATGTSWRAAGG